jgi:hypothetical protein
MSGWNRKEGTMPNKQGSVVVIFQDPVTERQPEGAAVLKEFLFESGNLEYWRVRFLESGGRPGKKAPLYSRWIRKPETKSPFEFESVVRLAGLQK